MPPDLSGDYRGHDGFRDLWRRWLDSWAQFRLEPEEVIDLGDAILVTVIVRGRGRSSGLETETRFYEVFRFRDGMIVRHLDFVDRARATAPRSPQGR